LSESENNKDFSLNERSLFEKEKVLGSNPIPRTMFLVEPSSMSVEKIFWGQTELELVVVWALFLVLLVFLVLFSVYLYVV